jgi:tripartite ATP-independent transporter DctP family solute receptor
MKLISLIKTIAGTALLSTMLHTAAAAEEWKFAHEEGAGDVQDLYAQEFKRRIEERTNGDVTITIYGYGQLGNENDITELTASGAVQFSNASPGHLGTFVPEVQVLSLPYLLSENPEVNKDVLNNSEALYGDLAKDFESKGLKLYTIYPEGEMVWTTNKEIRKPADFDGVKFRVMTSPILIESYKAFGSDPVALPWGEVYSGLQMNVIDAQVNPIFFIESAKFFEVTDYLTWAGQQEYTTTIVINKDFFDGLSDERKTMLEEIRLDMTDWIYDAQVKANKESLARIQEKKPSIKLVRLNAEERAAFEEAAEPLSEKLVGMVGGRTEQILGKLKEEIAAKEKELGAK